MGSELAVLTVFMTRVKEKSSMERMRKPLGWEGKLDAWKRNLEERRWTSLCDEDSKELERCCLR